MGDQRPAQSGQLDKKQRQQQEAPLLEGRAEGEQEEDTFNVNPDNTAWRAALRNSGPEVRSLTANDPGLLEREREYWKQKAAQETGEVPPLLLEVEEAEESGNTVSDAVATLEARQSDYYRRKEARAAKKALRRNPADFLSSLPEVEADVQYRFKFVVFGEAAADATSAACSSDTAAQGLPRTPHMGPQDDAGVVRCLCHVANTEKVAKLAFHPWTAEMEVPAFNSRQEAASTAFVFVLSVDTGLQHFEGQLQALAAAVKRMRARIRKKFRPVRAVLLCQVAKEEPAGEGGGAEATAPDELWAASLTEFEETNGELWKFGPVKLQDAFALHAAFAEMASMRIAQLANNTGEEDGNEKLEEEAGEAEEAEEEEEAGKEPLLQEMQGGNFSLRRPSDFETGSSSGCSEGWHRPPIYEAEADGSCCSDGAIERHRTILGHCWGVEGDEADTSGTET